MVYGEAAIHERGRRTGPGEPVSDAIIQLEHVSKRFGHLSP